MNIITKWLEQRERKRTERIEAKLKLERDQADAELVRRKALRNEMDEITAQLVEAGFVPIKRYSSNSEVSHANMWASRDGNLYRIGFNYKGGVSIELVK